MEQARTQRNIKKMIGDIDVPKGFEIMTQTDKHIAQQITLMDFDLFRAIAKREMTGQAWKKKDREQRAPHLLKMIQQFNQIAKWVQCVILQQRNKKRRTRCIEKMIHIAMHLKGLRNFSACCAIHFGLNGTVVYRQQTAWSAVNGQDMKDYEGIKKLFESANNWERLRKQHKKAHAPSILHCGLFLQDLLNTDEALDDKRNDGEVNFKKLHRMYVLIEKICMYQQSQYKIEKDAVMQQYLKQTWKRQATYQENKLYQISTTVKNRDKEGKDIDDADVRKFAW